MAKKKKQINTFCEPYVLPSDNSDLQRFIETYRKDMSEQIISSIAYALENNMPMVEIFQFKNSDFVVTLSRPHFKEHLDHIFDYYKKDEHYELCDRVIKLQNELKEIEENETKKAGSIRSSTVSTNNTET